MRQLARDNATVVFHGPLNRQENARLLCAARIGINPHDLSHTPGNVFAFKIVEYLAAGAHVISTPMGALELEIEAGITYMTDNMPATIAATLNSVIRERRYERNAEHAALQMYGPETVSRSLSKLLAEAVSLSAAEEAASR